MRISDWSSDVCSSDLYPARADYPRRCGADHEPARRVGENVEIRPVGHEPGQPDRRRRHDDAEGPQGANRSRGAAVRGGGAGGAGRGAQSRRSEEHTSELQSLMRISYAVFCLQKKMNMQQNTKLKT